MGNKTTWALRVVLVLVFAGSLFVQAVMVPLIYLDAAEPDQPVEPLGIAVVAVLVAGVLCCQVVMVCVWRLVTLVRRGTVFSTAAFRFVDVIIASIACVSLLLFTLGALAAPGEDVAPGVVLLIGGFGLAVAGIALVVAVLRALLAQAVATYREAADLRAELDEVI